MLEKLPNYSANIRLDKIVLKTSWRRLEDVFRLRLQKTSLSRRICSPPTEYVRLRPMFSKTSIFALPILLQNLFKTSCQDFFKTSWRRLAKTSSRHLQDVFKTFWRCLQDIFKISSRRLAKISSRRFQDV